MELNKYFTVEQCKQANGDVVYKVYGFQSRLARFLGVGAEYTKDNDSFEAALEQIEFLSGIRVIEKRVVFKTQVVSVKGKKAHRVKLKK